ncbi:LIM domain only protein 7-like isoform X1 [Poecilia formosa]|uniref:LIM domain only protein 7-like isoform X1 n=1 Tax=Poecilia formosa TaxID=48698 RepID=UPI0004440B1F|nr:PREDICTED: LIM domain only protein 7-like isoform X1 [Poecilia formosa]XP_007553990.1 PREDICTED: LIM domain only protein 7-like isoform X1 [Poecilia formosa]
MEWRQQSSVSCKDAFTEAQRWIEEVTGKSFGCSDFRSALENGVLLCDLINQLKPGIIKRMNRLSTPIAGLDNVNVFLKACGKLGLNESQLFHPGDLQDLSTRVTLRRDESQRRLKNVLITIYWLGRKAQLDTFYSGPQLNFKAFEGLLGLALSKALEEGSNASVKDGLYKECHYLEGEQSLQTRQNYGRGNSVNGFECVDPQAVRLNEEGFESDAEAEQVYKMDSTKVSALQDRGHVPPPLRRKQEREESMVGQISRAYQTQLRPVTPVQVNPGWIWSKSLSDIPMVYPARKVSNGNAISDKGQDTNLPRDWNLEIERKYSVGARDNEAQWQDDLTRWKNRRKSSKPELYRRSFERDRVFNHLTNGTVTNSDGNEATGGPIKRDQSPWRHSSSPRPYSVFSSKPLSSDLGPHTKVILTRSYTTEAPFSSQSHSRESQLGGKPESGGSIRREETYIASLAADGRDRVTTPSAYQTFTTQTQVKSLGNQFTFPSTSEQTQPECVLPNQNASSVKFAEPGLFDSKESTRSYNSALCKHSFSTEPKGRICSPNLAGQSGVAVAEDLTNRIKKSQETPKIIDSAEDGGACQQESAGVSKYLSRSTTWSSSASLPRGYRRSEGSPRLSSAITARPFGAKPSRHSLPKQYNADSQSLTSNTEDSHSSFNRPSLKRQTAAAHLRGQYQASIRQKKANQGRQTATAQKEEVNSRPSNHIQPQPLAKQQPRHNKSLVLAYNADLSKVDHSDMRVSLTLKPNSVPDFGFQTHWDSTGVKIKSIQPGSPAEHCQLCVDDEVVAVDGVGVAYMTYSQWKDKMASSLQTGSLTMDIRRYGIKDWSMNKGGNLNRPGQSMLTLNLTSAAPVLIGRSDHHANNAASTEMIDTQESQFNGQTHNETQDKAIGALFSGNATNVRRKENNSITTENQKKRTEFFTQKGGSESAISDIQVPSLNPSSSSWSWDREEDRRRQEKWQEEQERLLQEQYQRDQERLEAEWQRAQQAAMEGGMLKENTAEEASGREKFVSSQLCVNGLTKKTKDEKLNLNRDRKDAELKRPNDAHRVQNSRNTEKDWAEGSHGFAQLSHAHRAMSMSTPSLSGPYRQTRGLVDPRKGRALTMSKAERERLQILEEMKKRTQLLTDNSWIRQRSGSFHKEPIEVGTFIKRYESLDNLDILHQAPDSAATFTYPRPNSAAAVYDYQSRNASTRYSTGSISFQRNANTESSHHARMISGRRTCCMCERALGSGAAMVIDALSLCFHLTCFQCVGCHRHIGGTETGVQVRIRNRKPYCDYCYFQLKYTAFHM